jgi:hypothetical protein
MMFVDFHHELKLMPFQTCSTRPGAKILSASLIGRVGVKRFQATHWPVSTLLAGPRGMSAFGCKADMPLCTANVR